MAVKKRKKVRKIKDGWVVLQQNGAVEVSYPTLQLVVADIIGPTYI